jgi:DNA-binding winged helix-turn-helix (wHTH) protein/Tol biopolymer transport system component
MANSPRQFCRFGPFGLDRHERVLLRDGRPVPLPPKAFDMLRILVENHGHVVEKDELMKRVWPETFVEEANLSYHVFTLRKALGDDKDGARYIETISRRGYRFIAPVAELPDQSADPSTETDASAHSVVANGQAVPAVVHGTGTGRSSDSPHGRKAPAPAVVITAGIMVALAAGYGGWMLKPDPPRAIARFGIPLADGLTFTLGPSAPLALSPDGTRLAYTANARLYLRAGDQLEATPIPGVESPGLASARGPFFSPDGQWIGFWEAGQLKKVSVTGGAPVTICAISHPPYGATWADDNTILIGHGPRGIWRVSGNGGTPERIVTVEKGQRVHGPQLLPDGRSVLFTLAHTTSWDEAQIVVQSLDSGTRRTVIGGTDARYLSTGHLVYAMRDSVLGVQFDAASISIKGTPRLLVGGVRRQQRAFSSAAQFAVSSTGTLAYVEQNSVPAAPRTLVWVDRQGREEAIPAKPRPYVYPRLAPDGRRLAIDIQDDDWDIWVLDFTRGTLERVTSGPTVDTEPVWWQPDGQRLIFLSGRTGLGLTLFSQVANGSGKAEPLTDDTRIRGADTTTPDGKGLVVRERDGKGYVDLTLVEVGDGRRARPPSLGTGLLAQSSFWESNAQISRDGRWLAYQSDSSGASEIYVQRFPEGSRSRVSTAGGTEPLWARDGRELFYRSPTGAVMRVSITPAPVWTADTPTELFEASSYALGGRGDFAALFNRTYDVSLDGRQFLMIKNANTPAATSPAPRIVVVQNWFEELNAKVPRK